MVDQIGPVGAKRVAPLAPAVPTPRAPEAGTPQPQREASELGSLAKSMAAAPPIDRDRVAQIKRAIATGTFPLLPATIADRLMALRLDWNARDEA